MAVVRRFLCRLGTLSVSPDLQQTEDECQERRRPRGDALEARGQGLQTRA